MSIYKKGGREHDVLAIWKTLIHWVMQLRKKNVDKFPYISPPISSGKPLSIEKVLSAHWQNNFLQILILFGNSNLSWATITFKFFRNIFPITQHTDIWKPEYGRYVGNMSIYCF